MSEPYMANPIIETARDALRREVTETSAALKAIRGVGSGPMGLTPDEVKFSPTYREAKVRFDRAFAALRAFNAKFKPPRRER